MTLFTQHGFCLWWNDRSWNVLGSHWYIYIYLLPSLCSNPYHWGKLFRPSLWVPLQIQQELALRLPPRRRFSGTLLVCHIIGFWSRQEERILSATWHVVFFVCLFLCHHALKHLKRKDMYEQPFQKMLLLPKQERCCNYFVAWYTDRSRCAQDYSLFFFMLKYLQY